MASTPRSPKIGELMKSVEGVVFDLDGTLFDTINLWQEVDQEFFAKRNITYDKEEYFKQIMGMDLMSIARYTIEHYGLTGERPEDIVEEWREHYDRLVYEAKMFPAADRLLEYLSERNIPWGIATAGEPQYKDVVFKKYPDLERRIGAYVSCSQISKNKPSPDVYWECMREIGVEKDKCLVFEDSVAGLEGARNSGALVMCYLSDGSSRDEKLALADYYIEDFGELFE